MVKKGRYTFAGKFLFIFVISLIIISLYFELSFPLKFLPILHKSSKKLITEWKLNKLTSSILLTLFISSILLIIIKSSSFSSIGAKSTDDSV